MNYCFVTAGLASVRADVHMCVRLHAFREALTRHLSPRCHRSVISAAYTLELVNLNRCIAAKNGKRN